MISILLPTNRINKNILCKITHLYNGLETLRNEKIFTKEFIDLSLSRLANTKHYLEPTLRSLEKQKFRDFELIISHRYPEDVRGIVEGYNIRLKLVEEKPSVWHKLGNYGTLNNNINTAFIHSSGDLLWRLDDMTYFNNDITREINDLWKRNLYMTSKAIRCIDYFPDLKNKIKREQLGFNKFRIIFKGISGEVKNLTFSNEEYPRIPKYMVWGYSSTISRDDFLRVNGQDELYDGAVCGTDMDLGRRIAAISSISRVASKNYIYEVNDIPYKHNIRDDVIMRKIFKVNNIKGNAWKPNQEQMKAYEKWHKENIGELDSNWNKFMDVPFIDLETEYKLKRLGRVIYDSNNS